MKQSYSFLFGLIIVVSLCITACNPRSASSIDQLQCEGLNNPLAIDNCAPHFSWQLKTADRQTAYQILVASTPEQLKEGEADLWDSGKTVSTESIWIAYQGKPLQAKGFAYWKVRIWNQEDQATAWSETASFGIGLLTPTDWQAQYIVLPTNENKPQSPQFWKTFTWDGKGEKALLHINSLGYHEAYINGKPVSEAVLNPAVSQFEKRSLICTYDITPLLKKGENDLVLWLGKGWYQDGLAGVVAGGPYVKAQIEQLNKGVSTPILATDASWQGRESGYSSTGTWQWSRFGGERVDANQLLPDLTSASLKQADWTPAVIAAIPEHQVSPQMVEFNQIQKEMHPIACHSEGDTAWIYDMGTNLVGWTKINLPPLAKGQEVRISYCDFLDEKGQFREIQFQKIYHDDYYIAKGVNKEHFINKFNYQAYRYLRIVNVEKAPELSDITAYLIHTDYDGTSTFACSDQDLNAIHDMVQYTLRCLTLGGYMVDCPHLERLGYGGDGNASTLTAQTMFNLSPLYLNWMQAWADCMREGGSMPHTAPNPYKAGGGPYWCGFIISASWQSYVNYGDRRLLERYYPYMQQWLGYAEANSEKGLLKTWPNTEYRNWFLGDWATPEGIIQTDPTSIDVVNNSYLVVCYETISRIAKVLGKEADIPAYQAKAEALKQAVHKHYFHPEKKSYSTETQIDLIFPMLAGVTPKEEIPHVENSLYQITADRFKGHLSTGLVGIPIITEWAIKNKKADFMYSMLKKRDYPSYLYMVDNGATTMWEHWNGERSHIHNCYNGIGSWFYQALAGIRPDEQAPGYKHFFIEPQIIEPLTWVEASQKTPYGLVKVRWEKKEGALNLQVTIPNGSKATLVLPSETIELASGTHQFTCPLE
ncbi:MAG: family 78 glycoside hydrolase catalytic domain [Parabacteroides sp.]|nr:family 78 glycoside hydrolase catalytic domain [Parabacteroides sp.]